MKEIIVKTSVFVALAAVLVASAAMAQDQASAAVAAKGQMLVTANGSRLAPVYRVGSDGSAQIIIDGKMVTVPATTLSSVDGKLTTSLTKSEVLALH
jgi:hypothetical protein